MMIMVSPLAARAPDTLALTSPPRVSLLTIFTIPSGHDSVTILSKFPFSSSVTKMMSSEVSFVKTTCICVAYKNIYKHAFLHVFCSKSYIIVCLFQVRLIGQKYHAPQVQPGVGLNSYPPDHESTFHFTETPAVTTSPSVMPVKLSLSSRSV